MPPKMSQKAQMRVAKGAAGVFAGLALITHPTDSLEVTWDVVDGATEAGAEFSARLSTEDVSDENRALAICFGTEINEISVNEVALSQGCLDLAATALGHSVESEPPAEIYEELTEPIEAEEARADRAKRVTKIGLLGGLGIYAFMLTRKRVKKTHKLVKGAVQLAKHGEKPLRVDLSQPPQPKPQKPFIPDWVLGVVMAPVNAYDYVQEKREQRRARQAMDYSNLAPPPPVIMGFEPRYTSPSLLGRERPITGRQASDARLADLTARLASKEREDVDRQNIDDAYVEGQQRTVETTRDITDIDVGIQDPPII